MRHLPIALVAVAALGLSACKASDLPLTPEERVKVELLQAELEEKDAAVASWERIARERLHDARSAAARADKAAFDLAQTEMDAALVQYEAALADRTETAQQEEAIYATARERGTSGFLGMVSPFIPVPLQPLLPVAVPILGALFTDRSRKHLKAAAAGALKLQFGQALLSLGKIAGWAHSTPGSKAVADVEMNGGAPVVIPTLPEAPAPPAPPA